MTTQSSKKEQWVQRKFNWRDFYDLGKLMTNIRFFVLLVFFVLFCVFGCLFVGWLVGWLVFLLLFFVCFCFLFCFVLFVRFFFFVFFPLSKMAQGLFLFSTQLSFSLIFFIFIFLVVHVTETRVSAKTAWTASNFLTPPAPVTQSGVTKHGPQARRAPLHSVALSACDLIRRSQLGGLISSDLITYPTGQLKSRKAQRVRNLSGFQREGESDPFCWKPDRFTRLVEGL